MSSAAIQIRAYCPYCGRWRAPHEVQRFGAVRVCLECLIWSAKAMDVLTHGAWPPECQICHTPTDDLHAIAEAAGAPLQMAVIERDGIFQVTCLACARIHAGKRPDLYAKTPFGESEGID